MLRRRLLRSDDLVDFKSCAGALESGIVVIVYHRPWGWWWWWGKTIVDERNVKVVRSSPRIWDAKHRQDNPIYMYNWYWKARVSHGRENPRIESVKCTWKWVEENEADIEAWRCAEGVATTKFEFAQSCRGKRWWWRMTLIAVRMQAARWSLNETWCTGLMFVEPWRFHTFHSIYIKRDETLAYQPQPVDTVYSSAYRSRKLAVCQYLRPRYSLFLDL